MTVILLLIFLSAIWVPFMPAAFGKHKGNILSLLPAATFIFTLVKGSSITKLDSFTTVFSWIPQLGLNITWTFDGLSYLFVLLVSGIGTLVLIYANEYMKHYPDKDRFYVFLMLFMGSMLGLVMSGNLLGMFLFWELTSFTSFFLISFKHEYDKARQAALQSLLITFMGGLALFGGIMLLGQMAGSYEISDMVRNAGTIKAHKLYMPALILIMAGVVTKSAQFPFHFWLPGAMQAPSPVSAYLHSATMVKAGIFLLARLNPVVGGTQEWMIMVSLIGGLTMFIGAYLSLTQTDLKAILAYTTISALGTMVLLFGIGTEESVEAAILFLVIHALYKAALFMIAGLIDHKTGTRDINLLGELWKPMPKTFVIATLALLSMAGLPPMLGFIGKELIYEAKIQTPDIALFLIILGVSSNIMMVWASTMIGYRTFIEKPKGMPKPPGEKGIGMLLGPAVLVIASLIFGLFPASISPFIEPAISIIRREPADVYLKLWHGFNQVLLLSVFTVATGFLLFLLRKKLIPLLSRINGMLFSIRFANVFNTVINSFVSFSKKKTAVIQHGYHRFYLMTIFIVATLLIWLHIYNTRGWLDINIEYIRQPYYVIALVVIMILASLTAALAKSRLTAIISMGVVGLGIALIYLIYSAVDLAITQILAETLTLILFVLVLQKLPRFAHLSSRRSRMRDAIIALAAGSFMTILVVKSVQVNYSHPISDFFVQNSLPGGFGENVVNVILVDFRALDTMGEITVLTIAALGVFSLLKLNKTKR
jgi:multicomponent Na+:H+ antiporter subunit A